MYIFFGGESLIRLSVLGFRVQDYESSLKVKRGLLRGPGDLVGSKWSYKYPKWSYPNITIKINLHITDLLSPLSLQVTLNPGAFIEPL